MYCSFGERRQSCQLNKAKDISADDKAAVLGSQGVLFAMKRLSEAFLVSSSSTLKGTSAIPMNRLQFPDLDVDFTLQLFYIESQTGEEARSIYSFFSRFNDSFR